MIVKLLTEHHLEFLSLTGGCRGSSESTLVKMSNCWKSHAAAQMNISGFSMVRPRVKAISINTTGIYLYIYQIGKILTNFELSMLHVT